MRNAQTEVDLSETVAQFGKGALLYLPTGADGSGYFVAGWQADPSEGPQTGIPKGIEIGRYGAPPLSIQTPAGYVYLTQDFAPKFRREPRISADTSGSADASDDANSDQDSADDSGASTAVASSRNGDEN